MKRRPLTPERVLYMSLMFGASLLMFSEALTTLLPNFWVRAIVVLGPTIPLGVLIDYACDRWREQKRARSSS